MKIKLKINKDVGIAKPGEIVEIQACENGVPIDKFWRDRLKDSQIDNCIEIYTEKTEPQNPKKSRGKQ